MNQMMRSSSLQSYQLILYKRALHPELFQLKDRRAVRNGQCDFEAWLMPGGHALRIQHKGFCASELVTDREDGLPTAGAVATFPCAGEKDYEHEFSDGRMTYLATVQTETLTENLYASTYKEMVGYAEDTGAMVHKWSIPGGTAGGAVHGGSASGRCLSVLEIQRYPREIHVQSFHLVAEGGVVLRTQTIFEHE